ncbi:hypothetical protein CAPTEDRAFT_56035, partial [Capitella teleta]
WASKLAMDANPWIEVDLAEERLIAGIVTLGRTKADFDQYIKTFQIKYRSDESDPFTAYTNAEGSEVSIFVANEFRNESVFNGFNATILARYVRLYPLEYNDYPTLRWELFGCVTR